MAIERLSQTIRNLRDRFYILHGPCTKDSFISLSYTRLTFKKALLDQLKEAGFERIAFYSQVDKTHFIDVDSYNRAMPPSLHIQASPTGAMAPVFGDEAQPSLNAIPNRVSAPYCNEAHKIDQLMCEWPGPRTAMIFLQAELLPTSIPVQERNDLASFIDDWSQLPPQNRNVCIFVSGADFTNIRQFPLLAPALYPYFCNHNGQNNENVISVPMPGMNELQRMLDYARLQYRMKMDWLDQERLLSWMLKEKQSINHWLNKICSVLPERPELSIKAVIGNDWIPTMPPDGKTAHERLDGLAGLENVKKCVKNLTAEVESGVYIRRSLDTASKALPQFLLEGSYGIGMRTVVRLIGEILCDLGLLQCPGVKIISLNNNLTVSDADRSHEYIDETFRQIEESPENVIFIDGRGDGINQLLESPDAIRYLQSIIRKVESRKVILLAGLPKSMGPVSEAYPSLLHVFHSSNFIEIRDYNAEQLLSIMVNEILRLDKHCSKETLSVLWEFVKIRRNAYEPERRTIRAMLVVVNETVDIYESRRQRGGVTAVEPIAPCDLPQAILCEIEEAKKFQRIVSPKDD